MAPRRKKPTEPEAPPPEQKAGMTAVKKLTSLMKEGRSAYKDSRSIAGQFGQSVADAVEHNNLHRKAFASVRAEDRMEPEKLAEFYEAQDYYREALGLKKRAASAPKFEGLTVIDGGKEDADGEEDDQQQVAE